MAISPDTQALPKGKPCLLDLADRLNDARLLFGALDLALTSPRLGMELRNPLTSLSCAINQVLDEVEESIEELRQEQASGCGKAPAAHELKRESDKISHLGLYDLRTVYWFCERLLALETEFCNMPRTSGRAEDLIGDLIRPLITLMERITNEAHSRNPADPGEARERNHIIVRRSLMMGECENEIAHAAQRISAGRAAADQVE